MKQKWIRSCSAAAACWCGVLLSAAEPTLVFSPAEEPPLRLRVEVLIDGQSSDKLWDKFLDRWFDYLDRDANEKLNVAEASRAFPLPLDQKRTVTLRFNELDTQQNGTASRDALKAYYRRAGFTPVVVVIHSPSAADERMSQVLFQNLDRDGNGAISPLELRDFARVLRRLDEDEDEVLTVAELLAAPLSPTKNDAFSAWGLDIATDNRPPHAVLQADYVSGATSVRLSDIQSKAMRAVSSAVPAKPNGEPLQLRIADARCVVTLEGEEKKKSLQSVRGFYLAQFRTALESEPSLNRAKLEHDPSMQGLAALFTVADRDRQGKLTLAEFTAGLDLIEQGAMCQTCVVVRCHGRNLFWQMDRNQDGRVELREFLMAAKEIESIGGKSELTVASIPVAYDLAITRGTLANAFGMLAMGSVAKRTSSNAVRPLTAIRWFDPLDRNRDSQLSPQEFLGSMELFQKLDKNGDGLISADEAREAL